MNTNISGWATGSRLAFVAVLVLSIVVSLSTLFVLQAEARGDSGKGQTTSEQNRGEEERNQEQERNQERERNQGSSCDDRGSKNDCDDHEGDKGDKDDRDDTDDKGDRDDKEDKDDTHGDKGDKGDRDDREERDDRDDECDGHDDEDEDDRDCDEHGDECHCGRCDDGDEDGDDDDDNELTDVCVNLVGDQASVPVGYTEAGGVCTEIPVIVDACTNIDGVQDGVPQGYTEVGGVCTEVPVTVDACTNIDGVQEGVPEGYSELNGVCTENTNDEPTPASETPRGGGGKCLNCGDDEASESEAETASDVAEEEEEEAAQTDEEEGEVLGASCTPLLTVYMREGRSNPEDEVKKLQGFLNKELGEDAPVTGVFDRETTRRVEQFQLKYWQDVLAPWVPLGLPTAQTPTGYVYKTTLWKVNHLVCPAQAQSRPVLE